MSKKAQTQIENTVSEELNANEAEMRHDGPPEHLSNSEKARWLTEQMLEGKRGSGKVSYSEQLQTLIREAATEGARKRQEKWLAAQEH